MEVSCSVTIRPSANSEIRFWITCSWCDLVEVDAWFNSGSVADVVSSAAAPGPLLPVEAIEKGCAGEDGTNRAKPSSPKDH